MTETAPPAQAAIKKNLAFGRWLNQLAKNVKLETIPLSGCVSPAPVTDDELDRLIKIIDRWRPVEPLTIETTQALLTLRDHAAAYVMQHFPRATYSSPNGGRSSIPTNAALAVIARNWPNLGNGLPAADRRLPKPKAQPAYHHPSQVAKQQPTPPAVNAANWSKRQEYANRYLAEYRDTGAMPPFPMVQDPDDDDQLLKRAGWQDCYDHRDDPNGLPPPDCDALAIPGRWLPEHDPVLKMEQRIYDDIVKDLSRKSAKQPEELLQAHAQRRFNESRDYRAAAQSQRNRMKDQTQESDDLLRELLTHHYGSPTWRDDSLQLCLQLLGYANHLSDVYPLSTAEQITSVFCRIAEPVELLTKERVVREAHGASPKSPDAESANLSKAVQAVNAVIKIAGAPPEHDDPAVAAYWLKVAQTSADAIAALESYELPERQAPYEVEDLNRIRLTPTSELRETAVREYPVCHGLINENVLLIPGGWIITCDDYGNQLNCQHYTERFPDAPDFDAAIAEMDAQMKRRRDAIANLPHKLTEPPENQDLFWTWAAETAHAMIDDLRMNSDRLPWDQETTERIRRLLVYTDQEQMQSRLTESLRRKCAKAIRAGLNGLRQRRYNSAVKDLNDARKSIDPAAYGAHSQAAMKRSWEYQSQSTLLKTLIAFAQGKADE